MNETRKQIIELIWDYMDKSLIEWCYMQTQIWLYKYLWEEFESNNFKWWPNYLADNWKWIVNFNKNTITKIIGHYDITAVLKYIESKWSDITMTKYVFNVVDKDIRDWQIMKQYWIIANKPLYLYTEQEEKDLLDLLTKLKWWPTI